MEEAKSKEADLVLTNAEAHIQKISVVSKIRKSFRGFMDSLEDTILQFTKLEKNYSALILVLYLNEGNASFKRQELQFQNALGDMDGDD
jgi:hypothetical protein